MKPDCLLTAILWTDPQISEHSRAEGLGMQLSNRTHVCYVWGPGFSHQNCKASKKVTSSHPPSSLLLCDLQALPHLKSRTIWPSQRQRPHKAPSPSPLLVPFKGLLTSSDDMALIPSSTSILFPSLSLAGWNCCTAARPGELELPRGLLNGDSKRKQRGPFPYNSDAPPSFKPPLHHHYSKEFTIP